MNTNLISLDRLHDVVAPSPVAWWPPAPGWCWVVAGVVLLLFVLLVKLFIAWQHDCYRREALAEFALQEAALKDPARRAAALPALWELLKRTALAAYPREQVAMLT